MRLRPAHPVWATPGTMARVLTVRVSPARASLVQAPMGLVLTVQEAEPRLLRRPLLLTFRVAAAQLAPSRYRAPRLDDEGSEDIFSTVAAPPPIPITIASTRPSFGLRAGSVIHSSSGAPRKILQSFSQSRPIASGKRLAQLSSAGEEPMVRRLSAGGKLCGRPPRVKGVFGFGLSCRLQVCVRPVCGPMAAGLDGVSASRGSHLDFALDAHPLAAGLPR